MRERLEVARARPMPRPGKRGGAMSAPVWGLSVPLQAEEFGQEEIKERLARIAGRDIRGRLSDALSKARAED